MHNVQFLSLSLLSPREKSALKVSFGPKANLVVGRNQVGKSAILKSLYEVLGAKPQRIDNMWRSAQAYVLLRFRADGKQHSVLKTGSTFAIFDSNDRLQLRASSIGDELAPYLADLFDFRLVMLDRDDSTVIPPPSYIYAPYYVDQDKGWGEPWRSFSDLFLPDSPRSLADYHSGIRPNEYYVAQVERDRLRNEVKDLNSRRQTLEETLRQLEQIADAAPVTYDLAQFQRETDQLLRVSRQLGDQERSYRRKVAELNDEVGLWEEHSSLLRTALSEMDNSLHAAAALPHDVECPTCGQRYENSIVQQFGLVAEKDGILAALVTATEQSAEARRRLTAARTELTDITASMRTAQAVLDVQKNSLSFREVIAAEGRVEATSFIRARIDAIDIEIGQKSQSISTLEERMGEVVNVTRSRLIRGDFFGLLDQHLRTLDVSRETTQSTNIHNIRLSRGSEGPRGLAAYYVAFLQTAMKHGSSAHFPMVIDGPNQQGQDSGHMPQIMDFLLGQRPVGLQMIVGVEDLYGVDPSTVDVISLDDTPRKLLKEDQFADVSDELDPMIAQVVS